MSRAATTRVAVIGAAGFLGVHVVEELARRGHEIIGLTRKAPPASVGRVRWVNLDIDRADIATVEADACVHLAEPNALTHPADADRNLERARAVMAAPFRRIVYVSSAVVYGDGVAAPRRETEPVSPVNTYARSKRAVEELMVADPRCAIMRVANVYGSGMSLKNVLSDILGQLRTPGALRVRDLAPVRDYVHVRDVARALADAVEAPLCGIINVATGRGTSVAQLARLACTAYHTPERELIATHPGNTQSILVLEIERIRRELGWTPSVTIEQGVSDLVREHIT